MGEGQQWARKPGNLYSTPVEFTVGEGGADRLVLSLDQEIEPLPDPATLASVYTTLSARSDWPYDAALKLTSAICGPPKSSTGSDATSVPSRTSRTALRTGTTVSGS